MKPRNQEPNEKTGRVRKNVEFEPAVYDKAEKLIKRKGCKTLKALIETLVIASHGGRAA